MMGAVGEYLGALMSHASYLIGSGKIITYEEVTAMSLQSHKPARPPTT